MKTNNVKTKTREDWLNEVARGMSPMFEAVRAKLPEKFRVTMSLTKRKKAVGTCYEKSASADKHFEILIRVDQDDPLTVASILAHELTHAAVGLECGHKGEFRRVLKALGFEGKMTECNPGDKFREDVADVLKAAGPLPHKALNWTNSTEQKKQGTRMLKVLCKECGYTARVTRKWLDAAGAPICPCDEGGVMDTEDAGDEGDDE